MYRRHKIVGSFVFIVTFSVATLLNADYSNLAQTAISVISIALAVYIGAASVILGSDFAGKLKAQRDSEIETKTSLGVLAAYLRTAGICAVGTIAISAIYILQIDFKLIQNMLINCDYETQLIKATSQIISSASCSLFALNVFFIWLILIFLINSMTKSV
ncbi:MAG: hypothetical protein LUE97_05355 [Oscillospiraceae bacterium]|nr:hypothetical protein [Oscillospiraceae bacterium]